MPGMHYPELLRGYDEEYARKLNTSIEYRTWVTDTIPRRYGGNGPKRCPASRENVPILSDRFCGVLLAVASADVRYSRIIADSSKRDLFDAAKIVDVACQEPHDADHEIITNVQRLLRETIRQTFNEDELQDLYADLGVDYDSLPHDTCVQSIRELVAYFARHAKLNELLAACKRKRPNQFNWVEICG
jgi:hypothetical protein